MIDLISTAIPNPVILSDNVALTATLQMLPSLMGYNLGMLLP